MRRFSALLPGAACLWLICGSLPCPAAEVGNSKKAGNDKTPANVSAEDDPQTAMKKMRVTPGLKLELMAAEPLLENAVAFAFDPQGRVFIAETGRRRSSVFDIRSYRDWTDADLSFTSPEQRAEFLKRYVSQDDTNFMASLVANKKGNFGDFNQDGRIDWRDLEVETDRVRLLTDTNGDGVLDQASIFAEGFNSLISGLGAGVAAHRGDVFYTCIPDVWRLRDTDNDGKADVRQKLRSGFGVHIAYGGHDMHGAKIGPDGKLYWTIADRGFAPPADIKGYGFSTAFLRRTLPDTGAVFRCDPDGSNLEVVAVGLRNPQELAWDQFGNLFTVDNNADGGDKARVTYIVEGGDYGWRYGWQHLPKLGAWNTERLWWLPANNTALYSLPPVAHVTHGPSGLAYYPGTGLPERFNDHFFVADFPGGVRYFQVKPEGAGFTVENPGDYLQDNKPDNLAGKLLWNLYPTDVDFPPGGGIAVLDWVFGWEKTGKGRIYKLTDPAMKLDVATAETKLLLAEGMGKRGAEELGQLLGHRDQRVRLEAQWELARRRDPAPLHGTTKAGNLPLARVHGLWGLQQIANALPNKPVLHFAFSEDADARIRSQWAKFHGESGQPDGASDLIRLVSDSAAPVRFHSAQAIGKLKRPAFPALFALLRDNADRDPYLRHAAVCALVNLGDQEALFTAAKDASAAVRLGALLAMRRLELPEVAMFLTDTDPRLVLEAARAINDAPIDAAMPQLAAVLGRANFHAGPNSSEPAGGSGTPPSPALHEFTLRRAINAAFRLGKIEHAQTLVAFAQKPGAPEPLRVEALEALGDWAKPSGRDRVTGLWRPVGAPSSTLTDNEVRYRRPMVDQREGRAASIPLRMALDELLKRTPTAVRVAAIQAAVKLEVADAAPALHALLAGAQQDIAVRIEALRGLAGLKDTKLADAVKLAQADPAEALRKEASKLLGRGSAADAVAALAQVLEKGSFGEQQAAFESLATVKDKEADALLRKWLDRLLAGKVRPELQLDLVAAAAQRSSPSVKEKLKAWRATLPAGDALGEWRTTLTGGDAKEGRKIFYERAEAGCFRCHKVGGEGGDVGPELAGLSAARGRDYVLESILYPNKHIATGYESLTVAMKTGQSYAGILKAETPAQLTLNSPEDGVLNLPKKDIEQRVPGMSAMPEGMTQVLTKAEIRDLMEFLASAKAPGQ
jgi:quinoprotein glucose dehydrogenase